MTPDKMRAVESGAFDKAFKTPLAIDDGSLKQSIEHLSQFVTSAGKDNSMALRRSLATGQIWVVADIPKEVQDILSATTNQVLLSDDTLIKMIIHHPELDLLPLVENIQTMLLGAMAIIKQDDLNILYYIVEDKHYKIVIKSTRDRSELYMTTIFKMSQKEFYKDLIRQEKRGRQRIK